MLRPYIGILVATLLGGCSSTFFFLPDTPASPDPGPGPVDYQALIAKDLRQLKERESMGPFEISALRQTQLAQPGDWFACVRTSIQDRPALIAVFMREGRVVDRRQAVVIDGCAQQEFHPLKLEEPRPEQPKARAANRPAHAEDQGDRPERADDRDRADEARRR
jgi:hypothetical protein